MFYSNFMVMSFPFITMVEYNEKAKKNKQLDAKQLDTKQLDTKQLDAKQHNIRSLCPEKSNKSSSNEERSIKNDGDKKYCDMIFLSNLEEVVFHTSSSECLMRELLPETKNTKPVDYDKYLEFFE